MKPFELLKKFEKSEKTFCLAIINGQKNPLQVFATQIAFDVVPIIYNIFDKVGKQKHISLIIRSNGGAIDAPLSIINLIREYCDELDVYVPDNAHSAATLIALGGDKIIMSPISSLSPIDPQLNIQGGNRENNINFTFSVEDVAGYYALLDKLKIPNESKIRAIEIITQTISPTILGGIERARELIHIYAKQILNNTKLDKKEIDKVVKKLAEEIPSHNYRICRKEAKDMGLPIIDESDNQHKILKELLSNYKTLLAETEEELLLEFKEELATIEKSYFRAFIETCNVTFAFETKYIFHKNGKVDKVQNTWRKLR